MLIKLLVVSNKHGKRQDDYNFWLSLLSTIIMLILIWWALDWNFL